jgi:phosphohistidine phosphatase
MRHAKSSWKHDNLSDHDRPLNKRGMGDAPRMGRLLREKRLFPEVIMSSTALRAKTTAEKIASSIPFEGAVEFDSNLYLADSDTIVDVARHAHVGAGPLLIIAHNPGLEGLIMQVTKRDEQLPTAGIAHIRLPIDRWHAFRVYTCGDLVDLWYPKGIAK